ncbi:MAG: hypothetical protein GY877_04810 [Hyphomicrobium sp.]|nr:hypothetical protein [Hyphomicrobium sp.]
MKKVTIRRKRVPGSANDYHCVVDEDPDGETHADAEEAQNSYLHRHGPKDVPREQFDIEIVEE